MKIRDLIKQLEDMLLIYGDRTILTITDIESEYSIKEIKGKMCAKYFEPSDHVAEVTVIIKRNSSIKMLPSVTPEPEPCEDAVSRADVEIEIANILRRVFIEYQDIAKKIAAKLPSVTPKRKTGKWIYPYETTTLVSICSECGAHGRGNFCSNCGAEMRGKQDE